MKPIRRAERRQAARRLTKTRVYTMRANGEALALMSDCILIRRDGRLVTLHWQIVDKDGEPAFVRPTFVAHRELTDAPSWRVRLARWALRLGRDATKVETA